MNRIRTEVFEQDGYNMNVEYDTQERNVVIGCITKEGAVRIRMPLSVSNKLISVLSRITHNKHIEPTLKKAAHVRR